MLLLLAGCTTPSPTINTALTDQQLKAFFNRQHHPASFGITVYPSEHAPVYAGAHRLHQGQAAAAPFRSPADTAIPVIECASGGKERLAALVDTSASDNWLSMRGAAVLGVTPLGPPGYRRRPDHVYDDFGGYVAVAPKVRIEELHMENAVFYVKAATGPLGAQARWNTQPTPDAILGCAALRAFNMVQLDFAARQILLSAGPEYQPVAGDLIAAVPMAEAQGALACEGAVDGQPMVILLDTGGDFEFVMKDPPQLLTKRVSIGDLVFRQVNTESSYEQGLGLLDYPRIGRKLLSRFKITLNIKQKLIYFERSSAPAGRSAARPDRS
jgi:hypothetical protein